MLTTSRTARRLAAIVAAAALAAAAAGCSSASSTAAPQLYTFPHDSLAQAAAYYAQAGNTQAASKLRALAVQPEAVWAAGQPGDIQLIHQVTTAAAKAGEIPVLVAYNLPNRDGCGKFSASYGPSPAAYMSWIDNLAGAIGSNQAIVIVEPDGFPDIIRDCLSSSQAAERYQLLHYAMQKLGSLPHASVFLDAGNPGMFQNPSFLSGPLYRAGIQYGKGFSDNVSNFQKMSLAVAWAQQLERALGHNFKAVIDTSRNGNGPWLNPGTAANPNWCNPPGRSIGAKPKLNPGPSGIYAYLWIKDLGASDGPCNGGGPAGSLDPQEALSFATG